MNREMAEKLIEQTKKIDAALSELAELANALSDEAEKRKITRAFGELVWDVYEKITLEVVRQFPDLHPDKDTDPLVREKIERGGYSKPFDK